MTKEQEALIEKARKSLQAARLLLSNNMPDFAASRAYYTLFYIASVFLLGKGLKFSKHGSLIAAFGQMLGAQPPAKVQSETKNSSEQV
jgi:uncharacterized protein (UPF0332 family)